MTIGSDIVDSSGWLEYFAEGPNADHFATVIERPERLLVPSITILEVFKRIARQKDERLAFQYVALMRQGRVIDLDSELSLRAASLGLKHGLPLADSIIYACGQAYEAVVWTQDSDFEGLDGVRFFRKRST